MDGEKVKKRVGGGKSLSQLMEREGELEMKPNFKDDDYQRLSKMVESMNKRMDELELVRRKDREDYRSLCKQVKLLNARVNDIEVGDDFIDARRSIEEEKNEDKKQMLRLIEKANVEKEVMAILIERMNADNKRLVQQIEDANDDKKKMFQLIEDANARVDKLENKMQNETGSSQGLMFNSPPSSGKKVDRDTRIYVAKLPQSVSERHLHDYFGSFGEITNVKVVLDKITNLSRGFGFVTFKAEDSRRRVLCQKVHELHGSLLDVQKAIPRDSPPQRDSAKRHRGVRESPQQDSAKRHRGVRESPQRHGGASSSVAANTHAVSGVVQPQPFLPSGPPPYGYGFFSPTYGVTYPYFTQ